MFSTPKFFPDAVESNTADAHELCPMASRPFVATLLYTDIISFTYRFQEKPFAHSLAASLAPRRSCELQCRTPVTASIQDPKSLAGRITAAGPFNSDKLATSLKSTGVPT